MPAWPSAAYIHVPFCRHHCGYCDFTVIAGRDQLIPDYLRALEHELNSYGGPHPVDTLFLGGGTPTHPEPADLETLLTLVRSSFPPNPGAEVSIEANPETLTTARLDVLRRMGVNRLSLGVQSFDDQCLKTLERFHTASEASRVICDAAEVFPNVSLDLIFAVPGQTAQSWQATLQHACSLPVQHISTYGLTYEQGTPFHRKADSGHIRRTDDEAERAMYLDAIRILTEAGFEHYEVSNFARPGFQCRHNRTYWNSGEFFGVGPGAARYLHGVRSTNCRSVPRWLKSWLNGQECTHESEVLTPELRCREAVMLGLRLICGIHLPTFVSRYGRHPAELAPAAFQHHMEEQLLEVSGDFVRLTTEGLLLADSVVAEYL